MTPQRLAELVTRGARDMHGDGARQVIDRLTDAIVGASDYAPSDTDGKFRVERIKVGVRVARQRNMAVR